MSSHDHHHHATPGSTPLPVIANVSRVVTMAVDRITGDRSDYPLLVATACVEALKQFRIESRVMYGPAAWVEILENHSPIWAGCWDGNVHLWVATEFGEVVDLNSSVAHRKRAHGDAAYKALYSPPILWSAEVPSFYRYVPEGIAEIELTEERDRRWMETVLAEIREKCTPEKLIPEGSPSFGGAFPTEPMICPGRRVLDDSKETFRHFDRALSVQGVPQAPF